MFSANESLRMTVFDRHGSSGNDVRLDLRAFTGLKQQNDVDYTTLTYNNAGNYVLMFEIKNDNYKIYEISNNIRTLSTIVNVENTTSTFDSEQIVISLGQNDFHGAVPFYGSLSKVLLIKGNTTNADLQSIYEDLSKGGNDLGTAPILKLTGGSDSVLNSFYWFRPYLASDYQALATASGVTKKYFFLYSTDHDGAASGIYLGEGDDLNLIDFNEIGMVFTIGAPYHRETPFLFYSDSSNIVDGERYCLYIHSKETGNDAGQSTRLYTSDGSNSLLDAEVNWAYRGNVLGNEGGVDTHTGYIKVFQRGANDYVSVHLRKSSEDGTATNYNTWGYSTSTDGRTWSRGGFTDQVSPFISNASDYKYLPAAVAPFTLDGVLYGIGFMRAIVTSGNEDLNKTICLVKLDSNMQAIEYVKNVLPNGIRAVETYIIDMTAYVYFQSPRGSLYVSKVDLRKILETN